MKQLQGKYTNAIVYTDLVEQEALDQIKLLCDQPIAAGSRVRIMPDVHAGSGCTIGTTMTIGDKIIPALVGVDIGCGMYTVKLDARDMDSLFNAALQLSLQWDHLAEMEQLSIKNVL